MIKQPLIGQYGNGLKSGSMRIGNDMILFTKKNNQLTILLLSRTLLTSENISDVKVLIPSFDINKNPKYDDEDNTTNNQYSINKHNLEIHLLCKHSPFKTKEELLRQFDKIEGHSGTLVCVYNLKLNTQGDSEFEFTDDDILMRELKVEYDRNQLEHKSFKAYLSILYSTPKMKIYINNKKVQTKMLDKTLYKTAKYTYTSTRFKNKALASIKQTENELKIAKDKQMEANSELAYYRSKNVSSKSDEFHHQLTKYKREVERIKIQIENINYDLERKKKAVNGPKTINFIFGINVHNKYADGLFYYNSNRLIIMYEHAKPQIKSKDYQGIVGIVDVPFLILEPTHNKQSFADMNEHKILLQALSEHMEHYEKELAFLTQDFWPKLGYPTGNFPPALPDEEKKKYRFQKCPPCIQCDRCLKWRELTFNSKLMEDDFPPSDWECENNWDDNYKSCNAIESFKEVVLYKYDKTPQTWAEVNDKQQSQSEASVITSKKSQTHSALLKVRENISKSQTIDKTQSTSSSRNNRYDTNALNKSVNRINQQFSVVNKPLTAKKRTADNDPDFMCNVRSKISTRHQDEISDDTENDSRSNSQSSSYASSQHTEPTTPRVPRITNVTTIKTELACDPDDIQNVNQEALNEYDPSKLNKINNKQILGPGGRSAHRDVLERIVEKVDSAKLSGKMDKINKTDTKLFANEIFDAIILKERERVQRILLESNIDKELVETLIRKIRTSEKR
jgi:hypothetical protein